MKYILCLIVVLCFLIFTWRWVMPTEAKLETKKWLPRVMWSAVVAAVLVIILFNLSTLTSWKIY